MCEMGYAAMPPKNIAITQDNWRKIIIDQWTGGTHSDVLQWFKFKGIWTRRPTAAKTHRNLSKPAVECGKSRKPCFDLMCIYVNTRTLCV